MIPSPGSQLQGESWHCPQADLIPSCCRVLVSLASDSDPAGPADPGLQKPAERGARGLRLSQMGHFAPKARRPATRAIAAKKSKVVCASRLGLGFSLLDLVTQSPALRAPPPKPCPSGLLLEPRPQAQGVGDWDRSGAGRVGWRGSGPCPGRRSPTETHLPEPVICLV